MATKKTKAKKEALRGNERIQQLMEKFPEIPRTLVAKADLLREGIRPNAALHAVGRWALPDAHCYFEYDKEDTHTAEQTAEGYTLSPIAGHFSDGVCWMFMLNSKSPYEIRYEGAGRHWLYRDEDAVEEVFFPGRPQWYDRKTSSGKPMPSVMALRGEDFLFMAALTYCEYFKDNLGCRYCNINPSESIKEELGLQRLRAKRDQDIYETYVAAAQESDIGIMSMSGGVILDSSKEADNYARIVKALRRAQKDVGHEVPISASVQAMETADQIKLKEAGLSRLNHNTEVWDPRLWDIICPGKAKYVGRDRWIERLLSAVEVFGKGRVGSSFVLGIELAMPYGFKSEDEAAESVLGGWDWLMARGVNPGATFWRPVPGTEFAGMAPPRTEYFLRMSLAHYKLTLKHNTAPKRGRPGRFAGLSIAPDFPHVGLRGAQAAGPSPEAGPSGDVC